MMRVSYADLSNVLDGCSGEGWANISSADCDAAMHRYCASIGCFSSGYGPAEHSNGFAWITCLSSAEVVQTTFTMLSNHHSVCAADGERRGRNCNAAINRFCRSIGFVSGFGPVENDGDDVMVGCVRNPAHHIEVTYDPQLTARHEPCDGVRERIGPNCNAAIKRHCVSIGYLSGFGPNENYGNNAMITCVGR